MAAARIPPELYDEIFSAVKDKHDLVRHYQNTTARRRTLQYLSGFASVDIYWANLVRPRMFQILVLRSARDFYGLLALLRMPCSSRIRPISHCLRAVAVFYRLEDYFWCHDLERLQTNLVHEDFRLYVHISGRTPRVRNNEPRTVRHPLFSTLPGKVPFHWRGLRYVDLIIENADFPDGAGLLNLIRDISYSEILPLFIRCENLIWNDDTHLTSLNSTFSLNQHLHIEPFDVTTMNCTDNFLAAFTTHIYLGRRGIEVFRLSALLTLSSFWVSSASGQDLLVMQVCDTNLSCLESSLPANSFGRRETISGQRLTKVRLCMVPSL